MIAAKSLTIGNEKPATYTSHCMCFHLFANFMHFSLTTFLRDSFRIELNESNYFQFEFKKNKIKLTQFKNDNQPVAIGS